MPSQVNIVKQAGADTHALAGGAVHRTGAAGAATLKGETQAADETPAGATKLLSGTVHRTVDESSSAAAKTADDIVAKHARTTAGLIAGTAQSPTSRVAGLHVAGGDTPAGPGAAAGAAGGASADIVATTSSVPAAPVGGPALASAPCDALPSAGAFLGSCAADAGATTLFTPFSQPSARFLSPIASGASLTQRSAAHGGGAPVSPQAPVQGPAGLMSAAGAGSSGFAFSIFLSLLGLLLLGVPRAMRRLGLASESLRAAPFVLIPDRPG